MLILSINWPVVSYVILMSSILLIVLAIVISKRLEIKRERKAENESAIDKNEEKSPEGVSATESAVIAMALHLCYAIHDEESDVITIKSIHNRYSPWSSKIYGIQ